MQTVIVVAHLMIVVALVGVVLVQRSEGGGLGIGGGSGFMSARGAANALTRVTAILAAAFFATSIALTMLARYGAQPSDILNRIPAVTQQGQKKQEGGKGILDQLGGQQTQKPAVPTSGSTGSPSNAGAPATQAPAQTAPAAPASPVPNSQ